MNVRFLGVAAVMAGAVSISAGAQNVSDLQERLENSATVIRQIMSTPDGGVPDSIVRRANCIGVIPSVKKAAFVVGASYGQGVVTCRTSVTGKWSPPVFIRLAGGSFGFQIGGQATDLVLVAVNEKGFQDLLKSKFKLGADAAAAAGPVGRNASASTDVLLNAELLSYSRSKGLFAGIDLNGAVVSQNTDDTNKFYGVSNASYKDILSSQVPAPAGAQGFLRVISHYFHSVNGPKHG